MHCPHSGGGGIADPSLGVTASEQSQSLQQYAQLPVLGQQNWPAGQPTAPVTVQRLSTHFATQHRLPSWHSASLVHCTQPSAGSQRALPVPLLEQLLSLGTNLHVPPEQESSVQPTPSLQSPFEQHAWHPAPGQHFRLPGQPV
jgi:hypothetical protein